MIGLGTPSFIRCYCNPAFIDIFAKALETSVLLCKSFNWKIEMRLKVHVLLILNVVAQSFQLDWQWCNTRNVLSDYYQKILD